MPLKPSLKKRLVGADMLIKLFDLLCVLKDDVRIEYFVQNKKSSDFEYIKRFEGPVSLLRERRLIVQGASNAYVSYFNLSGNEQTGYKVCVGV